MSKNIKYIKDIKNITKQLRLSVKGRSKDCHDIPAPDVVMYKYALLSAPSKEAVVIANKNINHLPEKTSTMQFDDNYKQQPDSKSSWNKIRVELKIGKGNKKIIKKTQSSNACTKLDYIETYEVDEYILNLTSETPMVFSGVRDLICADLLGNLTTSLGS
ncbi:hypothetical protein [Candidatus Tisiphia endosymbiont of Beris chalybata]|uniref:hypothetical protein n=1 Tax=Candidatus Tisiphia endosymbiont of Beris chalybata TaxID=3066262 RepID=UPI00312C9491